MCVCIDNIVIVVVLLILINNVFELTSCAYSFEQFFRNFAIRINIIFAACSLQWSTMYRMIFFLSNNTHYFKNY